MDFMKILKSLEEALYEVMTWLVFYPLTLWHVIRHPRQMMSYADDELDDADDDRYSDKLSPPIFLAITLGLCLLLQDALGPPEGPAGILADPKNRLAFQLVNFSVFPLVLAVHLLRRNGVALDRKTLRPPFYAQCYVAAPWALVVGMTPALAYSVHKSEVEALLVALAATSVAWVWYMALQADWFARNLGVGRWRGLGHALLTFFEATILVVGLSIAISAAK